MRRGRKWTWFAAALGGVLLLGCEKAAVRQGYPSDPLFVSKKPVDGKPENARPQLAVNEPLVPPLPDTALASAPRERLGDLQTGMVLTHSPGAPAPGVQTHVAAKPATPPPAQPPSGTYVQSPP